MLCNCRNQDETVLERADKRDAIRLTISCLPSIECDHGYINLNPAQPNQQRLIELTVKQPPH